MSDENKNDNKNNKKLKSLTDFDNMVRDKIKTEKLKEFQTKFEAMTRELSKAEKVVEEKTNEIKDFYEDHKDLIG